MSLYEVGRMCIKIAGRDAGNKCVIVEKSEDNFVVVDGNVRRKKVNIKHLEPTSTIMDLGANPSHNDVKKAFESLELPVWDKKSKKVTERPRRQRKSKEAPIVEAKPVKKKVVKKAKVSEEKVEEAEAKE